jgi:hypothetical protein
MVVEATYVLCADFKTHITEKENRHKDKVTLFLSINLFSFSINIASNATTVPPLIRLR